jgi:hypothetical protein
MTPDGRLQCTTIPFHRERPITPNRTDCFDAIHDVQKGLNCYKACRNATGIMLVVDAVNNLVVSKISVFLKKIFPLFVIIDPFDETHPDFFNLIICYFKLKAHVKKSDKMDKVSIIFCTLKSSPQ